MERRLGRQAQGIVEGIDVRGTRSLVHDHNVFKKLADGLSEEDQKKATRLVDRASRELSERGTIVSFPVQVFKRTGDSMPTVYVAHSTDSNPGRRISVSFREGDMLGMWHADKDKKALGALRSMGYKA